MSPEAFYRWSALLPLLSPALALAFGAAVGDRAGRPPHGVLAVALDVTALVLFIGIWSALPYTLFLLAVLVLGPPRTEEQMRRVATRAPVLIGVPYGVIHALPSLGAGDWGGAVKWLLFWGGCAVGVGYMYVGAIEVALAAATRRGWVRRSAPGQTPPSAAP